MLQQTRVDTVIPYYGKWLERFPDLEALAAAEEDEVLRVWQGLGYYSRARRLHAGARVVRERFGGVLPEQSAELRTLPGVGEYTAGAVASIAFGEVVTAVDGNVRRVLARLFDLPDPKPSSLRSLAAGLVDPDRPGDFNQALMELGALICVPRAPRCEECPLASECMALDRGTVAERPPSRARKAIPEAAMVVLVAVVREPGGETRLLLRRRPDEGLLAGMWEFPGVEVPSGMEHPSSGQLPPGDTRSQDASKGATHEEIVVDLASEMGMDPGFILPFPSLKPDLLVLPMIAHAFSHLKVRYWPFLVLLDHQPEIPGHQWIPADDLDRVPLPVAQGKIARDALAALRS
jgi:A/G-specific adenine glycosylase